MSAESSWIAGLMRENFEAVGFIPEPAVERQYIEQQRFILQHDERGRRVGYLLHGAPEYGRSLTVAQHCIQYEQRLRGHGEQAVREMIRRAELTGCSAITLRCASELPAVEFWRSLGFILRDEVPGGERRQRTISRLWLPLALPLLDPPL